MTFKIEDSEINRENIANISDFTKETKEMIRNSDILIVPKFEFRENKDRVFYESTSDFYKLAKSELKDYSICICENSGDEKTLTLHSGDIWIPILLITIDSTKDIVPILPTIIEFVIKFIFYKFGKEKETEKMNVHLNLLTEDKASGNTKSLKYDGNPSGLKYLKIDLSKVFNDK